MGDLNMCGIRCFHRKLMCCDAPLVISIGHYVYYWYQLFLIDITDIVNLLDGYTYPSVFLMSSYGTPFAQWASYLARTAQFSLWASGAVIYNYIVTNCINCLLIGSRRISNGSHTNYCWAILAHDSKFILLSNYPQFIYWFYSFTVY